MHAIESRPLAPVSRDHESSTHSPPTLNALHMALPFLLLRATGPSCDQSIQHSTTLGNHGRYGRPNSDDTVSARLRGSLETCALSRPALASEALVAPAITATCQPGETHNSVRPSCVCVHPKCREQAPGSVRLTRCVWGLQMKGARVCQGPLAL